MMTAGRLLLAAFCWMTAAYAFAASSAFAYQQFIGPRVFEWVGLFSDWHAAAGCGWLAIALAVLAPDLRRPGAGRVLAAGLLAVGVVAGTGNVLDPLLPRLTSGDGSLLVGIAALVPIFWLSAIEHVRSPAFRRPPPLPHTEPARRAFEGWLFAVFAGAAMFLVAIYTVLTSLALAGEFEPDLMTRGLAMGLAWSVQYHLVIAAVAFLTAALIGRATGRHFRTQYVAWFVALAAVLTIAFERFIGAPIGLTGMLGHAAAAATATSIVAAWADLRLRSFHPEGGVTRSALDLFLGVRQVSETRLTAERATGRAGVIRLAAVGLLAWGLAAVAGGIDWDFMLLKCGVVAVWLSVLTVLYRIVPPRIGMGVPAIAAGCLLPLAGYVASRTLVEPPHALERYAVYNPSFRVADGILGEGPSTPAFDRYLRANTGFTDVTVPPVSIDLVPDLKAAPRQPPPDIFLFVIDSLRPDYLSPYNVSVHFTPHIEAFAAESLVFTRAFTRYGGTGMSMPALWAGSALLHKQYVLPFFPMNALDKVLDANGYRKLLGLDHITRQLLEPSPSIVELDRGIPEMQFDFCRTLGEIERELTAGDRSRPVFAHTRSLNLHVAAVRHGAVPPGESYPAGFHAPYATRVHHMDDCFGRFVGELKRLGRYDRSLIILTSDHGELLGEDGQWGHSYHMIPEVIQIPLLMHLPASSAPATADEDAIALSTDITPTVYAALGYEPRRPNGLAGRPLTGTVEAARARRRDSDVLAASYGAVYAVLRHNGRRLYIADAIRGQEDAYERGVDGRWSTVEISEGLRMINQLEIRRHVDEVARTYGVSATPAIQ